MPQALKAIPQMDSKQVANKSDSPMIDLCIANRSPGDRA